MEEIVKEFNLDKNLIRGFLEKIKVSGLIDVFTTGFTFGTDDTTFGKHAFIRINGLGINFCDFCISK